MNNLAELLPKLGHQLKQRNLPRRITQLLAVKFLISVGLKNELFVLMVAIKARNFMSALVMD